VAVTMWNTGDDAFEREVYGDFITVERRIAPNAGHFTLKNAAGRKVAGGRAALTAMLEALDLNAANPVAVLTQDTSRTFLAGSASDKKKYDLFMEATLLEHISETQARSENCMEEIKSYLSSKKKDLKAQKETLDALRTKVSDLQKLSDKKEYSESLAKAIGWQRVYQYNPSLDAMAEKIEVMGPQKLKKVDEDLMNAQAEFKVREEELNECQAGMDARVGDINSLVQECKHLQEAHKKAKTAMMTQEKRVAKSEKDLRDAEAKLDDIMSTAAEDEMEFAQSTQAAISEHKQKQSKVEESIRALEVSKHDLVSTQREQTAEIHGLKEQEAEIRQQLNEASGLLRSQELDLNSSREAGGQQANRAAVFFPHNLADAGMRLLQKLENSARMFHYPPVGPLGQHLSINDERWAVAVESGLGGLFGKFLVHDGHDAELLRKFARECRMGSGFGCVIRRFDTPAHVIPDHSRPPQGVPTLLDVVTCSTPGLETIVTNYLIDAGSAERVGLAESSAEGKRLAYGNMGLSKVYLRDGAHLYKRGGSEVFIGAGIHTIRPRLMKNLASHIAMMELLVEESKANVKAFQADLDAVRRRLGELGNENRQLVNQLKKMGLQKINLESQLNTIQTQNPEDMQMEDPKSLMEAQLQDVRVEISDRGVELAETRSALEQLKRKEQDAMAALRAKQEESQQLKARNSADSESLTERSNNVEVLRNQVWRLQETKNKILNKVEELEAKHAKMQNEQRHAILEAQQFCTEAAGLEAIKYVTGIVRAEVGEDATEDQLVDRMATEALEAELEKLLKDIKRSEQCAGGTLERLEMDLKKADKRYRRDQARFEEVLSMMMLFQKSVQLRRQSLKKLDRNTEANVQSRFKHYMSLKGHVGTIKLNRQEGKLVMSVIMQSAKNEKDTIAVEDLKSLSGGERSFTTVSFILALGEITDNPFRAMDEFDVFMDAVNRRISMQSLIKFAHDQRHVQFLFLTPQDIAAVDDARKACEKAHRLTIPDDFIKVVQMRPARANATVS